MGNNDEMRFDRQFNRHWLSSLAEPEAQAPAPLCWGGGCWGCKGWASGRMACASGQVDLHGMGDEIE